MDNTSKKLILNPVLEVPWKTQIQNYGNPSIFTSSGRSTIKSKQVSIRRKRRLLNIELLLTRFPGLKKYEARAALSIAKNELDKAILLLEVSRCYRKEETHEQSDMRYLRNVYINLCYDFESQDPTFRNIVFETSMAAANPSSLNKIGPNSLGGIDFVGPKVHRVGIIITKTKSGYKATPFDRLF